MRFLKIIIACIIYILTNGSVIGQSNLVLTQKNKTEAITKLSVMLHDYVYPTVGIEVSNKLTKNLNEGKYDDIKDFNTFAQIITKEMFELTNDNHLLIRYSPEDVIKIKEQKLLAPSAFIQNNYGFNMIKILPTNIGFIRIDEFVDVEYSGKTAQAALQMVAESDALIIDLRYNNGGWGNMVQFLCSYFLENTGDCLFEVHNTYLNEIIQYRNLHYLQYQRLLKKPLYILTSSQTYSAAEIFCDVLQSRNRAIIIGEITKGGAHSTRGPEVLTNEFVIKMPVGVTINSQTQANWEGKGISPDIKCNKEEAFQIAYKSALEKIMENNKNERFNISLGYSLMRDNYLDLAIIVFKKNIEIYSTSANAYDSLAEAYMLAGNYELAIKNYKKSLELNPHNTNAVKMLNKLLKSSN